MSYRAVVTVQALVEDYGLQPVLQALMELAATVKEEELGRVQDLLDAAVRLHHRKQDLMV